ncbi:uncharacterized protein LOC144328537 [Podarcis muralis]
MEEERGAQKWSIPACWFLPSHPKRNMSGRGREQAAATDSLRSGQSTKRVAPQQEEFPQPGGSVAGKRQRHPLPPPHENSPLPLSPSLAASSLRQTASHIKAPARSSPSLSTRCQRKFEPRNRGRTHEAPGADSPLLPPLPCATPPGSPQSRQLLPASSHPRKGAFAAAQAQWTPPPPPPWSPSSWLRAVRAKWSSHVGRGEREAEAAQRPSQIRWIPAHLPPLCPLQKRIALLHPASVAPKSVICSLAPSAVFSLVRFYAHALSPESLSLSLVSGYSVIVVLAIALGRDLLPLFSCLAFIRGARRSPSPRLKLEKVPVCLQSCHPSKLNKVFNPSQTGQHPFPRRNRMTDIPLCSMGPWNVCEHSVL